MLNALIENGNIVQVSSKYAQQCYVSSSTCGRVDVQKTILCTRVFYLAHA